MNTTKHGMRTLLASAAAGALVIGSASGALAHPAKPKAPAKPGTIALRTVDIHRHAPINIAGPETQKVKLRANVWDTNKDKDTTVTILLAQYDKRRGTAGATELSKPLAQVTKDKRKKSKNYSATVSLSEIKTLLGEGVPAAGKVTYLCIKDVSAPESTRTWKQVTKKPKGGDCVKIVNKPVVQQP
jgi:hypothetical protein